MLHIYTHKSFHFLYVCISYHVCVFLCLKMQFSMSFVYIFIFRRIRIVPCELNSLWNLCMHALNSKVSILLWNEHQIVCDARMKLTKNHHIKYIFEIGVCFRVKNDWHFPFRESGPVHMVWGFRSIFLSSSFFSNKTCENFRITPPIHLSSRFCSFQKWKTNKSSNFCRNSG